MTQDIPPDARDRASALFGDLIEGRWEKADRELDASLRGQVHLDRWFARAWAKAADSVGSFERIDAASARQLGGYTVVGVPLAFAAGAAIGEVVFGRDGKVAALGLEFPYPRPRRPEPGKRWGGGGFLVRNPEVETLMRTWP
jgi:hypothetical protein